MVAVMGNVLKTLAVCEAVSVHQPIGVRELAREIDMPKSTVQRALETLHAAGWLVRSEGGRWSLSLRCALIGGRAGQAAALRDLARPAMERLREITDESVRLWGHDGDRIVLLENLESRQTVRSVLQGDYPMIEGIVLGAVAVVIALNILVDLSYAYLNPKVRFA